jgi:hypothetical protein
LTKALLESEKAYVFTENDHCQLAALAWMLREALDPSATAKSWRQYVSDQLLPIRRSPATADPSLASIGLPTGERKAQEIGRFRAE